MSTVGLVVINESPILGVLSLRANVCFCRRSGHVL